MAETCHVYQLGLVPYEEAWQLHNRLAAEIGAGTRPATLLLLEHPHTYTFGRSGRIENLLWEEDEIAHKGITVQWVDRGGDVTYHGPGQLVGYPLIPLGTVNLRVESGLDTGHLPQVDYIGYLRRLESILIMALAEFGVKGKQYHSLTGVWVQTHTSSGLPSDWDRFPAKIAAIGVKVDARGISRHGFSLNVDPDMSFWEGIIGCGLEDYPETCLADLITSAPDMSTISHQVMTAFGEVFGYEMKEKPAQYLGGKFDMANKKHYT
jgi:lipoate-protein ligase B